MTNVVNSINKKYVYISNKVTEAYTEEFGLPCDLYFPIFDPYKTDIKYRDMKIFAPHQSPSYPKKPNVEKTLFYIPYLIKNDAINSSELEFDSFYTETEIDRPFIETSKKRELPLQTKVVVYQGESISKFFVDKKLVVTGASGIMLLRMYLSPLAKDNDEEEVFQEETEVPYECKNLENEETVGLGVALGSSDTISDSEKGTEDTGTKSATTPSVKKKKSYKKKSTVINVTDDLQMNIPED